jgi:hypothetical protein
MAFVSRNLSNVQSNLRNAIAECETGSSRKPVPMTYQNFAIAVFIKLTAEIGVTHRVMMYSSK